MTTVINRAKREIDFTRKTVPESIGPGTYDPANARFEVRHSQAPFSSTTDRAGIPEAANIKTPGPGTYNLDPSGIFSSPVHPRNVRPTSNFASNSSRMGGETELLKQAFMPGPGSYGGPETRNDWLKPITNRRQQAGSKPATPLTKSINWVKVSTAPSIPAPTQSFGYEEGSKGELIQQKPPTAGSGPADTGPGCYNPNDTLIAKRTATGVLKFGASKAARLAGPSKEAKDVPGPGSYDVTQPFIPVEVEMRPSHVFLSSSTRTKISSEKAEMPGPGSYDAPSSFKRPADLSALGVPPHLQCFGSTSRKLHEMASEQHPIGIQNTETPGPGAYTVSFTSFEKLKTKKGKGVKDPNSGVSTFGAATRFAGASTETNKLTPGPGYYPSDTNTLSRKIQNKLAGRYGVFGTTSQRFATVHTTDPKLGPGAYPVSPSATVTAPASYTVRKKDPRQAMFASKTERKTGAASSKLEDIPPVGAYELPVPVWIKKQSSQLADFMPHAPRFAEQKSVNTPGPGHYVSNRNTIESSVLGNDLAVYKGEVRKTSLRGLNRKGVPKTVGPLTSRFKEDRKPDAVPGPGAYEVEAGSLLRRTFNITIGDTWS